MNEQQPGQSGPSDESDRSGDAPKSTESELCRGSAWAALDQAFFGLVTEAFSARYILGADALLAANDDSEPQITARRNAISRHPSSFRRF